MHLDIDSGLSAQPEAAEAATTSPSAAPGQLVMRPDLLDVRVHAVRYEAEAVRSFELRRVDGEALPGFAAGAHIDIHLPGDIRRSYSLVNPQGESHRYVIAVGRDANSRGGSKYMCETLRVGDIVQVTRPVNTFPLVEDAVNSVLIAGGIGVTPIWSMAQRLQELGQPWRVYFAARTRANAAFLEAFTELGRGVPGSVTATFDQEPGFAMLDLAAIVAAQPHGSHFYCCGPTGMLAAFESATAATDSNFVHKEVFSATAGPAKGGFEVVLARSGRTLFVPPGKTILETVLEAGVQAPYSCAEGVCGTCETWVLDGVPDHRDAVLSRRERVSNSKMMICCSGCVGERLVLDL